MINGRKDHIISKSQSVYSKSTNKGDYHFRFKFMLPGGYWVVGILSTIISSRFYIKGQHYSCGYLS
ncbi:MAG: hypothetical protein ABI359_01875 [Ginsengibacter sp.]